MLALAKYPNVAMKATGAPSYSDQRYPFRDIHHNLRRLDDAFGAARWFWGTDIALMPWRQLTCGPDRRASAALNVATAWLRQ